MKSKSFAKKSQFPVLQLSDKELAEVADIRKKLDEIKQYKKLIAQDGLKPDEADKIRESELIVRLLRIEKNAKMRPKAKPVEEKKAGIKADEKKSKKR